MYITLAQLADRPGALELSRVASDAHGVVVDATLLDRRLRGGDLSGYTPTEIAQAEAVVARINEAITEATARIDGFLAQRG